MALADSYSRRAQTPDPPQVPGSALISAPTSGVAASTASGDRFLSGGTQTLSRPVSRSPHTAMQYQRAQVETASPTRLLILLHEGAIRFCQLALDAMTRRDLNAQHVNLLKAQRIISELLATLNHEKGGEVAASLSALYPQMLQMLVNANRDDQPEPIRAVQGILRDLCASWLEVERALCGTEAASQTNAKAQGMKAQDAKAQNTGGQPARAMLQSPPAKIQSAPRLENRNA